MIAAHFSGLNVTVRLNGDISVESALAPSGTHTG
jgi:hypothetical protein